MFRQLALKGCASLILLKKLLIKGNRLDRCPCLMTVKCTVDWNEYNKRLNRLLNQSIGRPQPSAMQTLRRISLRTQEVAFGNFVADSLNKQQPKCADMLFYSTVE